MADYLAALQAARPATNLVASAPHSAIRDVVIGAAARKARNHELRPLQTEVEAGLAAGARALSFGLIYAPGLYADTTEIASLAKIAATHSAPIAVHLRNEAAGILEAIREVVRIAEQTEACLHISHLKLIGSPHMLDDLMLLISDSRRRIDLTYDHYPYGAGSTMLSALLPPWALAGGPSTTLHRLRDNDERSKILRDMEHGIPRWENLYASCGPANITISHATAPRNEDVGKTVQQIAKDRNIEAVHVVLDLLADTDLNVTMIDQYASEEVVRAIFSLPGGLVGSDGIFSSHPHPRLYGTAAKVLGRFGYRERLISVEEAIARLSARAADRLGLNDRGRIKAGLRADLVLLDLARYIDTATYDNPYQHPPGMQRVFVGGQTAYQQGQSTGARHGIVTRTQRPR
jgi:N-acyl-D-amino-acid deacylase